jgi:hypothetical protein
MEFWDGEKLNIDINPVSIFFLFFRAPHFSFFLGSNVYMI